ncbi:MAG: SH3 domain-containing protein [Mollicutes bacterium]|nr:SH3 domain-containing protein [Mollicutes bacterium]
MKKIILFAFVVVLIVVGSIILINTINYKNAWKVEVTNPYINVRKEHTLLSEKIDYITKGDDFKVLEIYLEDKAFVWYKVDLKNGRKGWIASDRRVPYVKEINNPKSEKEEDYKIDYAPPIVKYFDEYYETESIKTINYDHLTIEEESKYKVTHTVFKEEKPKDRPGPEYWIQYVVTDSFGNSASKLQRIKFEIVPEDDLVTDFSKLNRRSR